MPYAPVDLTRLASCDLYDELPLWSAPFGLLMLERVPMRPGMTVLDVGAGTGFLSIELAQRLGARARVVAVDPWAPAVDRLRRKVAALGLEDRVQVLAQDAATIDLPAASVDLIVSNLGLNNFDDPAAVLRRCAHVAKSGASLLLTTNLTGHMEALYAVYRDTLISLGHLDRLRALDAHVARRGTIDSITRLLADGGFQVVDTVRGRFRMRFVDGASLMRHYFVRLGFLEGWRSVAPPSEVDATLAALERNLDALAARQGELALTIPMACFVARKGGRFESAHDPDARVTEGAPPRALE